MYSYCLGIFDLFRAGVSSAVCRSFIRLADGEECDVISGDFDKFLNVPRPSTVLKKI